MTNPSDEGSKFDIGYTPMRKIQPFWDRILNASQNHYFLDENVSIDECMVKFKGRHESVQYMPLKPVRFGFKIFALCEAKTGYC